MKKMILISAITLLFSYCVSLDGPNCHTKLTIVNKSDKTTYWSYYSDYPDIESSYSFKTGYYHKLKPDASYAILASHTVKCYEDYFDRDTLYLFIIDEQVLLNNTKEEIIANDMILKRYRFTLEEMQASDWRITYDGK